MHRTRNAAYLQGYRGFKSLPVRHHPAKGLIQKEFWKISGLQPPEWYTRVVQNGSRDVAPPGSILFGRSHEDVQAQRTAMIRAGTAAERDEFVMFVTIYEERPQ